METAYAQALYEAIEKGIDPKKAIEVLAARLTREGRRALLPRIAKAFARVAERESRKNRTTLSVAREHDVHASLAAAAAFAEVAKHDVRIDPTLIGGWRLETGDRLVDASYKKHLLEIFTRVVA